MLILTEQQQQSAIKSCERIQELCAQQERTFRNILQILDNAAKELDPKEGINDPIR